MECEPTSSQLKMECESTSNQLQMECEKPTDDQLKVECEKSDDENDVDDDIQLDSVRFEEKYIKEELIEKLYEKNINLKITQDDLPTKNSCYKLRRINLSLKTMIADLNKKNKSTSLSIDTIPILNDFISSIDYENKQLATRNNQISSYIYKKKEDILKYVKSIKLIPEQNPNYTKDTPVMMFWIRFNEPLRINFLGTRLTSIKENSSDVFQLFTNHGSPINYFLSQLSKHVENIVNNDKFLEENNEFIFKTNKYFLKEHIDPETNKISIKINIRGIKDPIVYKFTKCNDDIDFKLINKKIEEHELISTINSLQLKIYINKEGSNGTIVAWSRTSLAI